MMQNLTLRVLIGAAVGVAVWFILTRAISGITNVEVVVILILAVAAAVATIVGLGRKGRSSIPR